MRASLVLSLILGLIGSSARLHGAGEAAGSARAALPSAPVQVVSAPDSAAAVARAREAQARFERRRLRHVVIDRGGGWGSGCDEILGRMCLHLDEAGDWWPGEEDPELVAARDRLLEELAAAAEAAPGDAWILGQRIVYLGEAERWHEALRLARRCGVAEPGWCPALAGLALHASGRYEEAEAAFDDALAAMPSDERAAWEDVELLLDGDGRGYLDGLEGDARAAEVARFWRLSDPLYLVPGNDRRTEHFSRRVIARTRADARNAYAMRWGSDLDDVLVRYGWEVGWERAETRPGDLRMGGSAIGQHHPYTRAFVAPGRGWADPSASDPSDWNPAGRLRPRTGYAPRYAPVFLPAEGQISALRRGDDIVVVGSVALPEDTSYHAEHDHPPLAVPAPYAERPDRMGLFLVAAGGDTVLGATGPLGAGGLMVRAPAGRYLVSLEAWSPGLGRAGRVRHGLAEAALPPDVAALSDLLLARPTGDPASAEALLPHLLTAAVVAPGDTVRVGWELHGLGWLDEPLAYRLTLAEDRGGFLRAAGRFLGLVGDPRRVELDWTEEAPDEPGTHFRSVLLVVPEDAPEGEHRLVLELRTLGRETLATERVLEVRPDGRRRR